MTTESVPLTTQLAAARRELAMRRNVYPKWVAGGRMTEAKAGVEIAAMAAIVETLSTFERLLAAARPFAEVARFARGKPDDCWCGQSPAVIRYRDLEAIRIAVDTAP